jgi:hypothetical protein
MSAHAHARARRASAPIWLDARHPRRVNGAWAVVASVMLKETGAFGQRLMVECRESCYTQGQTKALWTPSQGGCELRKAISTVVVACAFVAGASGVASASQKHVATRRCGTKYTATCTVPKITNKPVSAKCISTGAAYTLPSMTFTSNSGIKKIQITEGGRTIKVISFNGQGRTQYTIKSLRLSTAGLNAGGHPITVKVTDIRGRSASKTLRFSVCVATPVFTG